VEEFRDGVGGGFGLQLLVEPRLAKQMLRGGEFLGFERAIIEVRGRACRAAVTLFVDLENCICGDRPACSRTVGAGILDRMLGDRGGRGARFKAVPVVH